jgi:hypothetical protein
MVQAGEGDSGECGAGCCIGIELDAAAIGRSRRLAGAQCVASLRHRQRRAADRDCLGETLGNPRDLGTIAAPQLDLDLVDRFAAAVSLDMSSIERQLEFGVTGNESGWRCARRPSQK